MVNSIDTTWTVNYVSAINPQPWALESPMYSVEFALKVEILNAIRAAGSAKTEDDNDRVVKRYVSVVRRAHLFGYDISAITFGDAHQPTAVWLKHNPVGSDR